MLTDDHRRLALRIARAALDVTVFGGPALPLPGEDRPPFCEPGACFVTLRDPDRMLRGCLGTLEARRPLAEEIRAMAAASASRDPRFLPVTAEELPGLRIDISVLSPLQPVADVGSIVTGQHGVMVRKGAHQGVLLPQVAVEHGWDAERLVSETCRKAGLPPEAAHAPDLEILVFGADVFGDPEG